MGLSGGVILCARRRIIARASGRRFFVEAGAYQGTGSKTVLIIFAATLPRNCRFAYKTFWLYGLFSEHPEGARSQSCRMLARARAKSLRPGFAAASRGYSNVRILKGRNSGHICRRRAGKRFAGCTLTSIRLQLKWQCWKPCSTKIVPGGIVSFDDYEFWPTSRRKTRRIPGLPSAVTRSFLCRQGKVW